MSHKKTGRPVGRPRGAVSAKRAKAMEVMTQLEAELGRQVNPLEGLLRLGSDTTQPTSVRVQCMAECLPYLYPKLQSQAIAVAASLEADVTASVQIDLNAIMMDPELAHAAHTLALGMAEESARAIETESGPHARLSQPRLLEADYTD